MYNPRIVIGTKGGNFAVSQDFWSGHIDCFLTLDRGLSRGFLAALLCDACERRGLTGFGIATLAVYHVLILVLGGDSAKYFVVVGDSEGCVNAVDTGVESGLEWMRFCQADSYAVVKL